MSELTGYLFFNGNCADAMKFYQKTLGGKLDLLKGVDTPAAAQLPADFGDRIMHARLVTDAGTIMASDIGPKDPYNGLQGFSIALTYPTAAEAKRVFQALAKDGKVTLPIDKSFWAEAFGMLTDRFGTPWMINGAMSPM